MGVKAISLPDELIKELEDAARKGNRGFSAEVRMRLERDKVSNPTGVAENRVDSEIKISRREVEAFGAAELTEERSDAEFVEKIGATFDGVSKLAKKIASEVPGVRIAADEPRDGSLDSEGITDNLRKSAKTRPVETEGRVMLVKGFWKEEYSSKKMAILSADGMGWKEGEYEIKPVKGKS